MEELLRENWEINYGMNNGDEICQWIYKDRIMVDKGANNKYGVDIYYNDEFIYFDIEFETLEEAMNFVEDVWQ